MLRQHHISEAFREHGAFSVSLFYSSNIDTRERDKNTEGVQAKFSVEYLYSWYQWGWILINNKIKNTQPNKPNNNNRDDQD